MLLAWLVFLILRVSVVRVSTDPGTEEVKDKRDRATGQANEAKKRTGPLIAEPVIHLNGEEDTSSAPE